MRDRIKEIMWGKFIPGEDNYIPYTEAESAIMADILERMPEESVAESYVEIAMISDRRAVMEYDSTVAELYAEKNHRMRKYMRKHELRNDGRPVRKEKRKAYTKRLCFSCDPWHGWDTVRKYRQQEAEKADARDWRIEQEAIAECAEAEMFRNMIIAEYERIETERRNAEEAEKLNAWLKYA